jgi:hypothetical protein
VPCRTYSLLLRGVPATGMVVVKMRLYCREFWVDVRVTEFDGAWLASADTPDGPTLGRGRSALSAAVHALQPFDGHVEELIRSGPPELFQ